LFMQVT